MAETDGAGPGLVQRLVVLTDGVLAITMTLLVLDVRLPGMVARGLGDRALWDAIIGILPQLFSFVLSFFVIATFWVAHVRQFRSVATVSSTLLWLNVTFLVTTGLVPFTTSVLAQNGGATGTALYAGVMALSSLILRLMAAEARRTQPVPARGSRGSRLLMGLVPLLNMLVFAVSIPLAFYDAGLAKWFWLMLIPASIVQGRALRGASGAGRQEPVQLSR